MLKKALGKIATQHHEQKQLEKQSQLTDTPSTYPNITIFGGDYSGNILGCRICPPSQSQSTTSHQSSALNPDFSDSDSDDFGSKLATKSRGKPLGASRISALTKVLAKEKGLDPALVQQQRQLKHGLNLRPVVSGELHAGSVGSIAASGRFVVTAGLQDESIKLSRRELDQSINKLKEFGSLHRHDSTITTVVFTPSNQGQLCLSGSENGIIYVWSTLNQWDCIGVLRSHNARIVSITAHPHANMALSLSLDNKLVMWDLRPGSFAPVFTTQLRAVKPSWGTQPLPPMSMIFSPDGNYYSVMYNRCIHTYHTTGDHAGKIMSIIDLPEGVSTLWSTIQYLDANHLIAGNEKGDMYIYNIVSTDQLACLTGSHQYRVKGISVIPTTHSAWLQDYTQPLTPSPAKPSPVSTTTTTTGTPLKKSKMNQVQQHVDPVDTTFIVSADSDGKIVLWQIEITTTGAKTVMIQPKAQPKKAPTPKSHDEFDDILDLDQIDDDDELALAPPSDDQDQPQQTLKFSYPIMTSTATILTSHLCHLSTSTRITCLCLSLPFDPTNLNPLGNQYRQMGHVMETQNESNTQYEDETDALYKKQHSDYSKKVKQQKIDDFKLKVRDYHRMKAGKIKSLAEGDAVKGTSKTQLGDTTPKGQRDRFRKMDEEFQKEHQKRQADKVTNKESGKKKMTKLEAKVAKRANPALAGTLKARRRNGGKKGPTTRGKRRF